jgi:hypothetical protein
LTSRKLEVLASREVDLVRTAASALTLDAR